MMMTTYAFLLVAGLLLAGAYAQNPPQTLDEALRMVNGNENGGLSTRMGNKVKDGLDMVLSKRQHDALYGKAKVRGGPVINLWTNNTVPYVIESYFDVPRVKKIEQGMRNWEKMTCLKFRPATSQDQHRIKIISADGCWSLLGMDYQPEQPLSLQMNGCFWRGTVEHELGHAIGLVHEHQRPERETYLRVNLANVNHAYISQLTAYSPSETHKYGLPYDYTSVMHYGRYAFSANPNVWPTIEAVYDNPEMTVTKSLGKALWASFTDVQLVNTMYQCDSHCASKPTCKEGCFVSKHCTCFCESDMPEVPCMDVDANCNQISDRDCWLNQFHNEIYCRQRCGLCAVKGTTVPPEYPVLSSCEDFEYGCTCDSDARYCPKSCGLCSGGSGSGSGSGGGLECRNNNPDCDGWAAYGECNNNPGYMLVNCKKACGVC